MVLGLPIAELIPELPVLADGSTPEIKRPTLDFKAGGYIQIECPPHQLSYSTFDIAAEFLEDWRRFDLLELESVVAAAN